MKCWHIISLFGVTQVSGCGTLPIADVHEIPLFESTLEPGSVQAGVWSDSAQYLEKLNVGVRVHCSLRRYPYFRAKTIGIHASKTPVLLPPISSADGISLFRLDGWPRSFEVLGHDGSILDVELSPANECILSHREAVKVIGRVRLAGDAALKLSNAPVHDLSLCGQSIDISGEGTFSATIFPRSDCDGSFACNLDWPHARGPEKWEVFPSVLSYSGPPTAGPIEVDLLLRPYPRGIEYQRAVDSLRTRGDSLLDDQSLFRITSHQCMAIREVRKRFNLAVEGKCSELELPSRSVLDYLAVRADRFRAEYNYCD
jgi:hypothetical protein